MYSIIFFLETVESGVPKIRSKVVKKKQKKSDIQTSPPSTRMVVLYFMYTLLEMVRLGGFLVFIRTLCDNIWNYIFILINANIFLLLFAELVGPKANEMLRPSLKKKKSYSIEKVVLITPFTSTFEMIKKYNTYNKYELVQNWYIQIEAPMNMFPDMYLFGSIDRNEPEILGIAIICYAYNENDIDFQVEMIK